MAEEATPFQGRGVVGVGPGGSEGKSPARTYAELYREAGFFILPRCRKNTLTAARGAVNYGSCFTKEVRDVSHV